MGRFPLCSYIAILAALLFFVGCSTGESTISPTFHDMKPDKVALVDIHGDIKSGTPKNQAEDFFSKEMLAKGYRVIERSRVNSVLDEQDFQHSDRTTNEGAARIGRVLNVPAVTMLDFTVDRDKVSVTGRLVDTETAEVLWIGTGRGGSGSTLGIVGGAVGGAVLGGLAGHEVSDGSGGATKAGAIGGGAVGGAAGDALTPQETKVMQDAIKKMVAELPDY